MKKILIVIISLILIISIILVIIFNKKGESMEKIKLVVNNQEFIIKLEDNSSSRAFLEKLKNNDIIVNAHDYGNFEKVGDLGFSLPTNDTKITTKPGDLILYQGNQITLYYDTNTWEFTKLGEIENIDEDSLKSVLGNDDVTLLFKVYKGDE